MKKGDKVWFPWAFGQQAKGTVVSVDGKYALVRRRFTRSIWRECLAALVPR